MVLYRQDPNLCRFGTFLELAILIGRAVANPELNLGGFLETELGIQILFTYISVYSVTKPTCINAFINIYAFHISIST